MDKKQDYNFLSETLYQAIYNSIDEVVFIVDKEYNILDMNQKGIDFLKPLGDPCTMKCYDCICKNNRDTDSCPVHQYVNFKNINKDAVLEIKGKHFRIKTIPCIP